MTEQHTPVVTEEMLSAYSKAYSERIDDVQRGRVSGRPSAIVVAIRAGLEAALAAAPQAPVKDDVFHVLKTLHMFGEEMLAAQPSTAENPNESAYQRGRHDGIIEYGTHIAKINAKLREALSALSAPEAREAVQAEPMELEITKEWFEKQAAKEGDLEIGAGKRTACLNLTAEEMAELERLALEALPKWAKDEILAARAALASDRKGNAE